MTQRLGELQTANENASVETRWCRLRDAVHNIALAVVGRAHRQYQDWFDENDAAISNLLVETNRLHEAHLERLTDVNKAVFCQCRRLSPKRLREMQDAWTVYMAEKTSGYADRNDSDNFFATIKAIYGHLIKGIAPFLRSNGSAFLTEKSQILKLWAEQFRNILYRPLSISDAAIDQLPYVEINLDLGLPSSLPETGRPVQNPFSGKASGSEASQPISTNQAATV
nr:unnamed protein product [Spirometra erinaceieuropaei]